MKKAKAKIEKERLLAKMDQERRELVQSLAERGPRAKLPLTVDWSATPALVSAAAIGWPALLRRPLRALAAIAVCKRIRSLAQERSNRRREHGLRKEDAADLKQRMQALRKALESGADPVEIEQLQRQLDERVLLLRQARIKQGERSSLRFTAARVPEAAPASVPARDSAPSLL